MKQFIHNLVTEIKYLYPCIAYEESFVDKSLIIKTETKLSKIYPINKSVKGMVNIGDDYWGRTTFKDETNHFFCEIDGELYYKGYDSEGEPHYPVKKEIQYDYPNLDAELIEVQPLIEKVKKYASDNNLNLKNTQYALKLDYDNVRNSKVICTYEFIV